MDVVFALERAGATIDLSYADAIDDGRKDAMLNVALGPAKGRFFVEEKRRAPYPSELVRLRARRHALSREGQPLLVVPFVSEALGPLLTAAGWSWADVRGNFDLRAPALVLRERRANTPPRPKRTKLPQGSGSLAIIRSLIRWRETDDGASATALARQANVTQPRASQVMHQLHDLELVERSGHGRWTPRREELLDRFLTDYGGPRGSEHYLYSLDSPIDVAVRVVSGAPRQSPALVSADVGPDLLVAWHRPAVVILYAQQEFRFHKLGLVEAQGRHDANVILRIPEDRSVFRAPETIIDVGSVEVPLADPCQQIWDLQDLGGTDRLEAAGMLREWLLSRP